MSDSISVPVWFRTPRGGLVRRDCLEPSERGSTYDYIKRELGLVPEEFGVPSNKPYDPGAVELGDAKEGKK